MSTEKRAFSRGIIALVLIFFVLKLMLPVLMDDDANLYLYMGRLVGEGNVPYRDFRAVHPPLMFYLSALSFKIFGVSHLAGRLVPALSGVAILLLTYLVAESAKKGLGNIAAVILFFSPHFQTLTNSMLGASLNLALLLASFYLLTCRRDRNSHLASGALFVLAALARYTPLPLFLIVLGYAAWKRRTEFFYGAAALAPVVLYLLTIPNFFKYTFLDLFSRNVLGSARLTGFFAFLIVQKWAVGLGAIGAYLFLSEGEKGEPLRLAVLSAASIILVLPLGEIRHWYVFYSLPFFAVLASYAVNYARDRVPKGLNWGILAALGLILFWGFAPLLTYDDSKAAEEILAPLISPGMVVYDLSGTRAAYLGVKYRTRVPLELVDNNAIALASGTTAPEFVVSVLERNSPSYLIDYRSDERTTYWMETEIAEFVAEGYYPVAEGAEGGTGNTLVIWGRR